MLEASLPCGSILHTGERKAVSHAKVPRRWLQENDPGG